MPVRTIVDYKEKMMGPLRSVMSGTGRNVSQATFRAGIPRAPLSRRLCIAICAVCVTASMAFGMTASAGAEEIGGWAFCTGNRTSHANCEGPRHYPYIASNHSTNGGWSWSWVWNERWGSNANSCQSGGCGSWAEVGGTAYGKEQMSNIAGGTYYFEPYWYGYWT